MRPDHARAADFIYRTARLIDRARLAFFENGDANVVLTALRAYRNPDGGFGHALEPDLRAPGSQPAAVHRALETLAEIDRMADPMVADACGYVASIAAPDGGLPFALPTALDYPCAPWWAAAADATSGVVFTAAIAGLLFAHGVGHPWVERGLAWSWAAIERFDPPDFRGGPWTVPRIGAGYEARAMIAFVDRVTARTDDRRHRAIGRLGEIILGRGLVELDAAATGDMHTPLDYAPSPSSAGRALFSDDVINAHLDALAIAQQPDGGWMFDWDAWNPATTLDWRGAITIDVLRLFERYGRKA